MEIKQLPVVKGGVILTDSDTIAQVCRRLKNHGRSRRGTFVHEHIGFNFSMTEMQAAVGVAQLKKLPAIIERKQQIYDAYMAGFADLPQLEPFFIDPRCKPVHWFTCFYAENRVELGNYLSNQGIQTRILFCPLHLQPCYEGWADPRVDYSVSTSAYERGLSLPSSYILTDEELDLIITKVHQFYQSYHQAKSA